MMSDKINVMNDWVLSNTSAVCIYDVIMCIVLPSLHIYHHFKTKDLSDGAVNPPMLGLPQNAPGLGVRTVACHDLVTCY